MSCRCAAARSARWRFSSSAACCAGLGAAGGGGGRAGRLGGAGQGLGRTALGQVLHGLEAELLDDLDLFRAVNPELVEQKGVIHPARRQADEQSRTQLGRVDFDDSLAGGGKRHAGLLARTRPLTAARGCD